MSSHSAYGSDTAGPLDMGADRGGAIRGIVTVPPGPFNRRAYRPGNSGPCSRLAPRDEPGLVAGGARRIPGGGPGLVSRSETATVPQPTVGHFTRNLLCRAPGIG